MNQRKTWVFSWECVSGVVPFLLNRRKNESEGGHWPDMIQLRLTKPIWPARVGLAKSNETLKLLPEKISAIVTSPIGGPVP